MPIQLLFKKGIGRAEEGEGEENDEVRFLLIGEDERGIKDFCGENEVRVEAEVKRGRWMAASARGPCHVQPT